MEPQFGTAALDEGECATTHRAGLRRLRRLRNAMCQTSDVTDSF